jgi:RND family efflux transporter MFP subunit
MTSGTPSLHDLRIRRDEPPAPPPARGRRMLLVMIPAFVAIAIALFVVLRPKSTTVEVATVSAIGGGAAAAGGISANGYVVARTKASVSPQTAGRLEYLGVAEGSRVKRGEILARIENDVFEAQIAAARARVAEVTAQLTQARRDLDRARTLRNQNILAEADLENAQTGVDVLEAGLASARAQVRLAQENYENTLVRAPFDGTVLRKDAEVGEIVAPASAGGGLTRTAIVTMADLGTLEVEVDVNEAYIAQVRNGQEARITLDAYPDTSFSGQVRQVVPTADRQKATVLVKVAILDRDPRILPEMGAKVVFVAPEAGTVVAAPRRVTVPAAALVREGDAAKVWVVENGRVRAQAIELGRERGDAFEVSGGLTGGETVVVTPPAGLGDGDRVRVGT